MTASAAACTVATVVVAAVLVVGGCGEEPSSSGRTYVLDKAFLRARLLDARLESMAREYEVSADYRARETRRIDEWLDGAELDLHLAGDGTAHLNSANVAVPYSRRSWSGTWARADGVVTARWETGEEGKVVAAEYRVVGPYLHLRTRVLGETGSEEVRLRPKD